MPLILLILLVASVVCIVLLTARFKLHPLFAICFASYLYGLGANGMSILIDGTPLIDDVTATLTFGFGNLIGKLGLLILFGTCIGKILENSGGAKALAHCVLDLVGRTRPALALSGIGWFISITVFCDSGYVVLSSLKKRIAKSTGVKLPVLSVALATGLFSSHTFVIPTPGPLAAAANLNIGPSQFLSLILIGGFVSLVAAAAGYFWAIRIGNTLPMEESEEPEELSEPQGPMPSFIASAAPILVPMGLIALASTLSLAPSTGITALPKMLGQPTSALLIGLLLAIALFPKSITKLTDGVRDAAPIILITGMGGAFGSIIKATPLADAVTHLLSTDSQLGGISGLAILFGLASLIKMAQGSSTTAIIVTSSLAASLLSPLGLSGGYGPVLAVAAIGAGSMVVSHVNDSYFWIVSQFSGMTAKTTLKVFTLGTAVQGAAALFTVLILGFILL